MFNRQVRTALIASKQRLSRLNAFINKAKKSFSPEPFLRVSRSERSKLPKISLSFFDW